MAAAYGAQLVPHNWQSEIGKLMSIHAAKVKPSIRFVEDDRYRNYAIDASQYLFRDGQRKPPDTLGWDIELSDHYERFARSDEEEVTE